MSRIQPLWRGVPQVLLGGRGRRLGARFAPARASSAVKAPTALDRRPQIALERRGNTGPDQPRPGHRSRPEPMPKLVRGLDGPPPPILVEPIEHRELLSFPEARRRHAHEPDPLATKLGPGESDRGSP